MSKREKRQLAVSVICITLGLIGLVALVALNSGCASAAKQSQGGALIKDASYTVTVNYRIPLTEMKSTAGYGKIVVDDNPSPVVALPVICTPGRSPAWGVQTIRFRLIQFTGDDINLAEAAAGLSDYTDWGTLATAEELLAFSVQYPEVQKKFKVIAAGTDCLLGSLSEYRYSPYVYRVLTSAFGEPTLIFGMADLSTRANKKNIRLLIRER